MFKRQLKSSPLQLISILFLFALVTQAYALTDMQLRSLTTPLEASQLLSNIQELRLDGVTSQVPTRPEYVTPLIGFLFIASRFCVGFDRQGRRKCRYCRSNISVLALSLTFGSANTWYQNFYLTR